MKKVILTAIAALFLGSKPGANRKPGYRRC
jgi:hypothetical protein